MSGPVTGFERVHEFLFWWEIFDTRLRCPLSSAAVLTPEGLVLIDPVGLPGVELARLTSAGRLRAILLTNENHQRDAAWYRDRFRLPVHAPAGARFERFKPDHEVHPGSALPGGLAAIRLEGASESETAYLDSRGAGSMLQGDAIIHLKETGLAFLPLPYAKDQGGLRRSAAILLRHRFEWLTTAHGRPVSGARRAVGSLIGREGAIGSS